MNAILYTNNEAVQVFLRRGNHETSLQLLLKALDGFRALIHENHQMNSQAPQDLSFSTVSLEKEDSKLTMDASPSNMFALFPKAFVIYSKNVHDEGTTAILSVGLMFNIGLAFHLRGLRRPGTSRSDLAEALRYYKLGLALVQQNTRLCSESNAFYLSSLALLNNAGHIFWHFCRIQEANNCINHMDTLLQGLNIFNIAEDHAEFFLSNVFFSKSFEINVAAAAWGGTNNHVALALLVM